MCRSRLGRLRRDRRGVSALEFALAAPLVFGVLFIAIEVAVIMLADAHLDIAANRVARIGRLGIQGDCRQAVEAEMRKTLAGWTNSKEMYIDAKVYHLGDDENNGFIDPGAESYQPECDAGERGDMVIYRLGFYRPGLTGFISLLSGDRVRYERVVLIQNEPS